MKSRAPDPRLDALLDTVIDDAALSELIDAIIWEANQPEWWPHPQIGVEAPNDAVPF